MAAGSWYSILPQHHGMPRYLCRLCIRVRRRSRDRRDVWSGFAYDVALADLIVSEVHSRLCTCMCECELRHFYASSLRTQKIRAIVYDISEIKIDIITVYLATFARFYLKNCKFWFLFKYLKRQEILLIEYNFFRFYLDQYLK